MRHQRILVVHNYYKYSGGEDAVFDSEKILLRERGHNVFEYTDTNARIESLGYINSAIQTIWSQPSYHAIKNKLRDVRPDLVHFQNTFMLISPSAYYACVELGIPVIQSLHNYRLICPGALLLRDGKVCEICIDKFIPLAGVFHKCYRGSRAQTAVVTSMLVYHRLIRTWQNNVDMFIATSEFSRQKFIQGGLTAEKIVVKPNIIKQTENTRNENKGYVLFVGRLSVEKGINVLLDAWGQLPDIPVNIIGDGPLRAFIEEYVENRTSVTYLGFVSALRKNELMQGAHFLIFPSTCYENFPMTIIEAFSLGLPVIAPKLGSMLEVVHDSKTGLFYSPGDASDLALKVRWLWEHPDECAEMGRNARREYEEKYTADRNYQMLMDIYTRAADAKS